MHRHTSHHGIPYLLSRYPLRVVSNNITGARDATKGGQATRDSSKSFYNNYFFRCPRINLNITVTPFLSLGQSYRFPCLTPSRCLQWSLDHRESIPRVSFKRKFPLAYFSNLPLQKVVKTWGVGGNMRKALINKHM